MQLIVLLVAGSIRTIIATVIPVLLLSMVLLLCCWRHHSYCHCRYCTTTTTPTAKTATTTTVYTSEAGLRVSSDVGRINAYLPEKPAPSRSTKRPGLPVALGKGLRMFAEMRHKHVRPSAVTFSILVKAVMHVMQAGLPSVGFVS